ncbi:MAG: glycerol-3-phosphate 1-O-acyltransferase PlsY [Acidimicrobiia bacterium]
MTEIAAIVASYLLGSVSFAIIVATSQGVDIRTAGSGNPGMSNVMRVLGKRQAGLVLFGDALKGAAAAALGVLAVDPAFGYVTLAAAVVGHSFPVWHRFKGGKSVATVIGGFMYLAPWIGLAMGVIWILLALVWKRASIASLVVMVLLVPALAVTGRTTEELLWGTAIALFVIVRHFSNIRRLVGSNEESIV